MEGSGPIHLSRVYCTGFETRLVDCPSLNADINCDSGNDVGGIRCRPSGEYYMNVHVHVHVH